MLLMIIFDIYYFKICILCFAIHLRFTFWIFFYYFRWCRWDTAFICTTPFWYYSKTSCAHVSTKKYKVNNSLYCLFISSYEYNFEMIASFQNLIYKTYHFCSWQDYTGKLWKHHLKYTFFKSFWCSNNIGANIASTRPKGLGAFPEEKPKPTREATVAYQQELQQQVGRWNLSRNYFCMFKWGVSF